MTLESLIILEYLNRGLIPYFPGRDNQPLEQVLTTTHAPIAKRKFRKVFRKALKQFAKRTNSQTTVERCFGTPHQAPDAKQLSNRKRLVYTYIRSKAMDKYKVT